MSIQAKASIEIVLTQQDIDTIADCAVKKIIANAIAPTPIKTFPKIGEFWPEQGGYLGAIMRGKDQPDYCLIVSPKECEFDAEFGSSGKEIETSEWDGFANTQLMIKASAGSYPAAEKCCFDNGFNDWFIGSKREMRALYANVSELFDPEPWYWTSTQYSSYNASVQDFVGGGQHNYGKYDERRVRPVRRLFI